MPRLIRRWSEPAVLTGAGVLAWALAVAVQIKWHVSELAATFVAFGFLLFVARALLPRIHGRTRIANVETDVAPDISVRAQIPAGPAPSATQADPSTLPARWPTLEAALQSIPLDWTKDRIVHDDGQEYVHVKSPQGGFDIVINVATCDSPAPRWLMVAIHAMDK